MAGNNVNILHVNLTEGLVDEVAGHLKKINAVTPREKEAKWEAQEFIKLFQSSQLSELRKAFE
jgi:hypothetical protein